MALSDDVPRDMVVGKELCMEEQTEEQAMGFGYVLFDAIICNVDLERDQDVSIPPRLQRESSFHHP